jgi:hypothetical protein
MPQIGESTNGIQETLKFNGTSVILLFHLGVFTSFSCGLVTTQDISIIPMPQIGESTNGVQETPKLNGTSFILLFPIGVLM